MVFVVNPPVGASHEWAEAGAGKYGRNPAEALLGAVLREVWFPPIAELLWRH